MSDKGRIDWERVSSLTDEEIERIAAEEMAALGITELGPPRLVVPRCRRAHGKRYQCTAHNLAYFAAGQKCCDQVLSERYNAEESISGQDQT